MWKGYLIRHNKQQHAVPPLFAFLEKPEGVLPPPPIRARVKKPSESKVESYDSPVNSTLF